VYYTIGHPNAINKCALQLFFLNMEGSEGPRDTALYIVGGITNYKDIEKKNTHKSSEKQKDPISGDEHAI
jgi:hypothetical protein